MITSKVAPANSEIELTHEQFTEVSSYKNKPLFIESGNSKNNTLTTINFNGHTKVYVFWESFLSAEFFEVLYIPETGLLFLGSGSVSARVDLRTNQIVDIVNVCLFWEFSTLNQFVLETGELDCFLYDLDGHLISKTVVDPPYDMEITELGIRFDSIVVGETWLKFSENG